MKLRDVAHRMGLRNLYGEHLGCSDSNCIWGPIGGMMTNGGCACLKQDAVETRFQLLRMAKVARALLEEKESVVQSEPNVREPESPSALEARPERKPIR